MTEQYDPYYPMVVLSRGNVSVSVIQKGSLSNCCQKIVVTENERLKCSCCGRFCAIWIGEGVEL